MSWTLTRKRPYFCEPIKMASQLANQACIDGAIGSLPLSCEFYMRLKPFEFSTCMKVSLGWQEDKLSSRNALIEEALDCCIYNNDEEEKDRVREPLLNTGQFDTKDLDETQMSREGSDCYIQRLYAGYTRFASNQDGGLGVAVIFEDSITLAKALMLVEKMLCAMTDAEAMDISPDEPQSKIPNLEEKLLSLLMTAREPSIRHCYLATRHREKYDFSSGRRRGALWFLTADGREIEVTFASSFG
jgi:hypothetical protein